MPRPLLTFLFPFQKSIHQPNHPFTGKILWKALYEKHTNHSEHTNFTYRLIDHRRCHRKMVKKLFLVKKKKCGGVMHLSILVEVPANRLRLNLRKKTNKVIWHENCLLVPRVTTFKKGFLNYNTKAVPDTMISSLSLPNIFVPCPPLTYIFFWKYNLPLYKLNIFTKILVTIFSRCTDF